MSPLALYTSTRVDDVPWSTAATSAPWVLLWLMARERERGREGE